MCGQTYAGETDNFYLPSDRKFADLGDYLETLHTRAIEAAVDRVNRRIEHALKVKAPHARKRALERYHSPEFLVDAVATRFGFGPLEEPRIAIALGGSWARKTFPDQTVSHRDISMNLLGRIPIDFRALLMFGASSTVKAYGVYFGADKLVHFHQLGSRYYYRYRGSLRAGLSPDEAYREMIEYFGSSGFLSELHVFGMAFTGIYSNADMASNQSGFKFLLNLTEPVVLKGKKRPPLVVPCGVFLRVNDHVYPRSGWFRWFISDHWNEALNPSLYDASMRPGIRRFLKKRAKSIVEFYTRVDGRPQDPAYYERLARELSTYYGESYGHSGEFEKLLHIGNTCLPALKQTAPSEPPKATVKR